MRVLVLSRNYPNDIQPRLGLWVQRQTAALARHHDMTVIAPSLYCPPLPLPGDFAKFRGVARESTDAGVEVFHPRFVSGPGYTTYALEARSQYLATVRLAVRLHRQRRFDLIHAHFTYPDGVVAALLGRRIGIPIVITEHNLWRPWMDQHRFVRGQARWALERAAAIVVVSGAVRLNMEAVLRRSVSAEVVPIGVDGDFFKLRGSRPDRPAKQILYVGWPNRVKGVDVLLRAIAILRMSRPGVLLSLIGGSDYRDTQAQEHVLRRLASELGLDGCVRFEGPQSPDVVAQALREADVVVVPSRRESCGAVLLEALASGTPVVATRSGGPQEIVTPEVGALAPVADPAGLAAAVEGVLARSASFDPEALRRHALARFSWQHLAERYDGIYRAAIDRAAA